MSTTIFDFKIVGKFRYPPGFDTAFTPGNEQVAITRPDSGVHGTWRAEFDVAVPGYGCYSAAEKTIDDFWLFIKSVQGAYDTWLLKDPGDMVRLSYEVLVTDADGQIGTGDSVETDFNLAHVSIDTPTLNVYVNGVLQTLTTHYTLEDNNTTQPLIRFVSAPGAFAVTVAYEFFFPVRFLIDPGHGDWRGGGRNFLIPVSVVEDYAGAHRSG